MLCLAPGRCRSAKVLVAPVCIIELRDDANAVAVDTSGRIIESGTELSLLEPSPSSVSSNCRICCKVVLFNERHECVKVITVAEDTTCQTFALVTLFAESPSYVLGMPPRYLQLWTCRHPLHEAFAGFVAKYAY